MRLPLCFSRGRPSPAPLPTMIPNSMLAGVYRGSQTVLIETVPVPMPGPGEVLVRVQVCGVCGTDLKKIAKGLQQPPRIYGHETAGEIAAIGPNVSPWRPGDRVAVNHHVPCLQPGCHYCSHSAYAQCPVYKQTGATAGFEPAGGGFAQYVLVKDWCVQNGLIALPPQITIEEASFLEPLNTCMKALQQAPVQQGDVALIYGQGPIGQLFTLLLRLQQVRVAVADPLPHRREAALQAGAEKAVCPEEAENTVKQLTAGRGADLAVVAVAQSQVIAAAMNALRPAGCLIPFAQTYLNDPVELDAGALCMQEKKIIGSYSSDITLQNRALELIASRLLDVRPLISHRFPLTHTAQALQEASSPGAGTRKVLVLP